MNNEQGKRPYDLAMQGGFVAVRRVLGPSPSDREFTDAASKATTRLKALAALV